MYFEVWLDASRKDEVLRKLREICDEVHEIFYDYDCIVRVSDENVLRMNGVKKYRRHYDC